MTDTNIFYDEVERLKSTTENTIIILDLQGLEYQEIKNLADKIISDFLYSYHILCSNYNDCLLEEDLNLRMIILNMFNESNFKIEENDMIALLNNIEPKLIKFRVNSAGHKKSTRDITNKYFNIPKDND